MQVWAMYSEASQIDKVGRKRWYAAAFLLAVVPLVVLTLLGRPRPSRSSSG